VTSSITTSSFKFLSVPFISAITLYANVSVAKILFERPCPFLQVYYFYEAHNGHIILPLQGNIQKISGVSNLVRAGLLHENSPVMISGLVVNIAIAPSLTAMDLSVASILC